jgi:hypothetical protein
MAFALAIFNLCSLPELQTRKDRTSGVEPNSEPVQNLPNAPLYFALTEAIVECPRRTRSALYEFVVQSVTIPCDYGAHRGER